LLLVSIDLKKAFDSVNTEKLLQKLKLYGISDIGVCSYLSDRKQFVFFKNNNSSLQPSYRGVPQGSILGPILFSLFINDFSNCVLNDFTELFADDSKFIFWGRSDEINQLKCKVKSDMNRVVDWVHRKDLDLNANKTKLLIFSNFHHLYDLQQFSITLNNIVISTVQNFKCLGLVIDNKLRWDAHINQMARICFLKIKYLYTIRDYLPKHFLILVGQALVLSIVSYMCSVWDCAAKKHLKVVEKIIRSLARVVLFFLKV